MSTAAAAQSSASSLHSTMGVVPGRGHLHACACGQHVWRLQPGYTLAGTASSSLRNRSPWQQVSHATAGAGTHPRHSSCVHLTRECEWPAAEREKWRAPRVWRLCWGRIRRRSTSSSSVGVTATVTTEAAGAVGLGGRLVSPSQIVAALP